MKYEVLVTLELRRKADGSDGGLFTEASVKATPIGTDDPQAPHVPGGVVRLMALAMHVLGVADEIDAEPHVVTDAVLRMIEHPEILFVEDPT